MAASAVNYFEKPGSYFTAVEAGADTTQLKDLQEQASKLGYAVLKATAGADYIFEKALKDAKFDNYAKELQITQPAKLQRAFVITPAGKLASKKDAEGFHLEGDVFTSMLSAVGDFMEDALTQSGITSEEPYKSLTKGNFTIEMVYNQNFTTAAIYEGHDSRVKDDLKKTHAEIDKCYGEVLRDWDGAVTGEIESLENVLRENLFDTQKYTGEHDINTIKQLREQRRWKALDAIENLAKEKKILLYLDNLEDLDSATIQDLYHIARNAKDKFMLVGVYHADNINDEPDNKDLQNIIDKLKEEKLCETAEIKSSQSVYDVLPHISENAKKVLQLAALGATGSALQKASGLNTADFVNAYIELQGKRLLVDDRVATRKLAGKVAEEITDEQTYLAVANAIEAVNKDNIDKFAGVLSDLYSKTEEKDKAAKWAKTAAEFALKNADLIRGLEWYSKLVEVTTDNKEKGDSLEKVVELGFYQLSLSQQEADTDRLEKLALAGNDTKRQAVAKLMRGKTYVSGGRLDEALVELEKAGKLFSELGETGLHTDALYTRGVALNRQCHFDEARTCFETILATTNDKRKKIKALSSIGYGHIRKGDLLGASSPEAIAECSKAVGYFEESLKLADTIDDLYLKTNTLSNLAAGYVGIGKFSKAKEYAEKAIELYKGVGNLLGVSNSLTTIGYLEGELGNLAQGLKDNDEAIRIAEKIGASGDSPRANKVRILRKIATEELRKISNPQFLTEVEKIKINIDSEEVKIISAKKEKSKK